MKRFFSFIIRQTVATLLIVLFVIGFGIYSTIKMPINLLPDINVPMVCVQVIYPGANAQSVEKDVTVVLEEGLSSISGVSKVTSYSYDNLSALVLSFDYGTDTNGKKSSINSKLNSLALPEGVTTSVYDIDLNAEALAVLSVTGTKSYAGENLTEEEREDKKLADAYVAAKEISTRIKAIDGVERVEIKGGPSPAYVLRPFGGLELISPLIVQAFSYGALDIPLGNVTEVTEAGGKVNVQIRNNSDVECEEDIYNMPVTLPEGMAKLLLGIRRGIMPGIEQRAEQMHISVGMAVSAVIGSADDSSYMTDIIAGLKENPSTADLTCSPDLIRFILRKSEEQLSASPCVVKASEIAKIDVEDNYSSYVYFAGGDATVVKGTIIEVYKANGANASAVVASVKDAYNKFLKDDAELGANAKYNAKVTLLDDQSEFISDSISNVLISMLIGGVLAVIIIFFFLKKIRASLIIAVTMPLSVLAALICLSLMGITLNMVSLGGLAVGIGMLVDNSIVVIESISKHRDAGKSAFAAAVDGTCEVGGALIGSTLTTVCVFIPIIFAGGLTGEIFTDLSWAVIFSLAFSLIVAVTVIPTLYALFNRTREKKLLTGAGLGGEQMPPAVRPAEATAPEEQAKAPLTEEQTEGAETAGKKKSFKERLKGLKEPRIMNAISSFYAKILPKILNKKLITVIVAVVIFGGSIGMLFLTGTEFLPSIDKGQIEVNMTYNSGVELADVQENSAGFAELLRSEVNNVDYVSVSVGKNGLLALTDTGIIKVQLTTNRDTDKVVGKIRDLADGYKKDHAILKSANVREIDGVVASLMSGSDNMSVTILGNDTDTLKQIAGKIKTELEKPENGFKDVATTATDTATQYTLKFDRLKMSQLGLDYQTTVMTLRIGVASYTACTVTINDEVYDLNVCFDEKAVPDRAGLENFVVGATADGAIKLKDILQTVKDAEGNDISDADGNPVKILVEEQEACIRRTNGKEMVSVTATLPGVDTGTAGKKMQKIAAGIIADYEGYSFEESGITGYLNDAFSGLVVALVISFFLLYGVMAVQFGSFLLPLIVMSSIPFSFTGGFLALVITRTSLNVVSFIGLIMLMGVVVNNAIVMLEKIKQLHDSGMEHYTAVQEACKVRLRPIFMTTLTTILALIPLAIGVGQGSELMQPLGIVVMGGLLIGTLVTLIIVPTVYCAIHGISAARPEGRKKLDKKIEE